MSKVTRQEVKRAFVIAAAADLLEALEFLYGKWQDRIGTKFGLVDNAIAKAHGHDHVRIDNLKIPQ